MFARSLVAAAAIVSLPATFAHAATITSLGSIGLPGASTGVFGPASLSAPNNDNAALSPNQMTFSLFLNAGGVGNVDIEFNLATSGGTTEYRVIQSVVNNTGIPWTAFHFELGFGIGAAFVRSPTSDALDFDTPDRDPTATSNLFPVLTHVDDTLDWSGATISSIGVVTFAFAIDVPDGLTQFHPLGLNRFTLRQRPIASATAPEPAIVLLLGAGVAACLRRRARA